MARNLSVSQFQDLMKNLPKQVAADLANVPREQAELLAQTMRSVVPTGVDGYHELLNSIRVMDGRRPLVALVLAGGPLTTRSVRQGSSETYDYAIAQEFGTRRHKANPFFWPTYRLMKKRLRSAIARKAKQAIEKAVPLT